MNVKRIVIFLAAVALLITGIVVLSDDIMSPYVPFNEAKKKAGTYVQIIGSLDKAVPVEHGEGKYLFTMVDKENGSMRVVHGDVKPLNFEHAEQIVVLGRYSAAGNIFEADKILVKCPSKYSKDPKPSVNE